MDESAHLDRFGSERADDDYARGDSHRDVFLETQAVRNFLVRDPSFRYVLGTMGSGKSILLLKLREHIEATQRGVILAPTTGGRVFTPSVEFANAVRWTAFWKLERNGRQDINAWTQMWEWALLRCILFEWSRWSRGGDDRHSERFAALTETLRGAGADPFTSIAEFVGGEGGLGPAGNPRLPTTRLMREFLEANANDFPPTYAFIDSQDDFFQESPHFWTASALGCKYAIDQIVRRSNHRVHLVMTLRPEMLWRTKADADALRFRGDMFSLDWSFDEVIAIFARRAGLLRDDLLRAPRLRARDPFAAFFGRQFYDSDDNEMKGQAKIDNHAVGRNTPISESLTEYLFRHTLGRPREIILIGNQIIEARLKGSNSSEQKLVRDAVAAAAHTIALAYIGEIKQRWPWRVSPDEAPGPSLQRFLRDYVGTNVIATQDLSQIEREYFETCEPTGTDVESTPFSVLASAGLVGWLVADKQHVEMYVQFFPNAGAPDAPGQRIPATVKAVLVHPILYGHEFAIQARKGLVVGPGVRTTLQVARQMGLV